MHISAWRLATGVLIGGALAATPGHGATVTPPVNPNYPQNFTPTVSAWGIDDTNTSTLNPYPVTSLTASTFLTSAQPGSPFAAWTFNFVGGGAGDIPASDLTVNIYSAWAVINDPLTDLGGTQRARPMNNAATAADAGGADWELTYTPRPDPANPGRFLDPTNISFLQVFRERICTSTNDLTCTFGAFSFFFDNGGSMTTPFYVQSGGIGGNGITNGVGGATTTNANAQWMVDIPYDCENSGTPNSPGLNVGASANCRGGVDGAVLATDVQFQVFPATFVGTTVTVYRGVQWGYLYSNTDVPEPASLLLAGAGMAAFGLWGRRRRTPSKILAQTVIGT